MSFAATLRHRITVLAPPEGSDGEANPITEWSEMCKLWADIRIAGGLEQLRAGAITSKVQASIRIRPRAGLNAGMRIAHSGTTYEILAVPPAAASRLYMDLICEVRQ